VPAPAPAPEQPAQRPPPSGPAPGRIQTLPPTLYSVSRKSTEARLYGPGSSRVLYVAHHTHKRAAGTLFEFVISEEALARGRPVLDVLGTNYPATHVYLYGPAGAQFTRKTWVLVSANSPLPGKTLRKRKDL